MDENQGSFRQVTSLFYNGQYEQGMTLINYLIEAYPANSLLYVNRALFSYQLGEDLRAMEDLEKAIQLNPFNYIAYFNLFSVLTRNHKDLEAFDNLCCSLSCMYLLKAKSSKDVAYAQKSLEYASNNQAAQLLRDFLMLDKKKYEKLAASEDQDCNRLQDQPLKIRKDHPLSQLARLNSKFRLKGPSIIVHELDLLQDIKLKVKEFNSLYFELTDSLGAVTEKVPKQQSHISNNIETFMRQRSNKSSSNKQSMHIDIGK